MGVQDWTAAEAEAKRACAQWTAETPGGAVLGFDAEALFFAHAGGLESLSTRTPFSPDSVLRYASVTKHVFASLVLSRPDVIGLDDPLGRHLPELQPALAAVTVGRALDMSGGIPDTRECLTLIGHSIFTETKAPDLLAFHAAMDRLNYPAGTEVSYSNGGYRLVEEALRRHGILFEDFVGSEIRDGLGLAMQAPEMWTDPLAGLVPGYWHDGQGWKLGLQGMHLSAAGSLSGSARALAGWGQALLRGEGSFAGRLAALSALRPLADGRMTGYGLGLRQSRLGQRYLVGHGGSQPGYKTYLLLDPQTRTGCVAVANRDDANTAAMAMKVMAALLGETLPVAGSRLTPGLYVTESGADWLRLGPDTACRLDDEVALYPANEAWADSQSASSRVRLHHEGPALAGEIGHAPKRYLPVAKGLTVPADLAGDWTCPAFGARLSIAEGAVVMGAGPTRRAMPLTPLGAGRFLFTLQDGPWSKRICLNRLGPDRFELVLSRARMIVYQRG